MWGWVLEKCVGKYVEGNAADGVSYMMGGVACVNVLTRLGVPVWDVLCLLVRRDLRVWVTHMCASRQAHTCAHADNCRLNLTQRLAAGQDSQGLVW